MGTKDKVNKKRGINSNLKGKSFERRVANILSKSWGVKAYRSPGSGAFATTHRSKILDDTIAADVVVEGLPIVIECKDYKTIGTFNWLRPDPPGRSVEQWWTKVTMEADKVRKVPLLVCKSDRTPIVVIMNHITYSTIVSYTELPKRYIEFSVMDENKDYCSLFCINISGLLGLEKSELVIIFNEITDKIYGR